MKTVICGIMLILLTGCASTNWKKFGRALASGASTYGGAYNQNMATQRDIYRTYDPYVTRDEVYTYEPTKVIAQPVIMGNGTTGGYTFIAR